MANSSPPNGLGAGLLLLGLLGGGGALLFFVGRTFSHGAPVVREENTDSHPPMYVAVAGSGLGAKSLEKFGCDLSHIPRDAVAAWIALDEIGAVDRVNAFDEKNQEWPLFSALSRGHEACYIVPFGYDRRPKGLKIVVKNKDGNETKEFPFPALPAPKLHPLPKPYGAIPGLKLERFQNWLSVAAKMEPGHALLCKPLATNLLGPAEAPFAQVALSEGQPFSVGNVFVPRGPHENSAQDMALEFTEVKGIPHTQTVEFRPFELVEQFGETWIRRGHSNARIDKDLTVSVQSRIQIPFRTPRKRQDEYTLFVQPQLRSDLGVVHNVRLVDPLSVAGLPLSLRSNLNGTVALETPLTRTETGPAVGRLRVKAEVSYDTFVPVRKAVVIFHWPALAHPPGPTNRLGPPMSVSPTPPPHTTGAAAGPSRP